jgi:hypothetical protein
VDKVRRQLPRAHRTYATFRNVFWADIVRGRQKDYVRHAEAMSDLKVSRLRRFVIEGLGDAAAYQKTRLQGSAYYLIQAEIARVLKELDAETAEPRPLIFIGHSLGCHIISSYAWDLNKLKHRAHEHPREDEDELSRKLDPFKNYSPFRRLETFAGFVTLGSNMPLFTFTFGPQRVYPITHTNDASIRPAFPGSALRGKAREQARWLNFYSDRDILGYPLKPLNDTYAHEDRIRDIRVRSEGWTIPPWNTIRAHTGYRDNRIVIRETAKLIQDLIEAVGDAAVASAERAETPRVLQPVAAPATVPPPLPAQVAADKRSVLSSLSLSRTKISRAPAVVAEQPPSLDLPPPKPLVPSLAHAVPPLVPNGLAVHDPAASVKTAAGPASDPGLSNAASPPAAALAPEPGNANPVVSAPPPARSDPPRPIETVTAERPNGQAVGPLSPAAAAAAAVASHVKPGLADPPRRPES